MGGGLTLCAKSESFDTMDEGQKSKWKSSAGGSVNAKEGNTIVSAPLSKKSINWG